MDINTKTLIDFADSKEKAYTAVNLIIKLVILFNKQCFKYKKLDLKFRIKPRINKEVHFYSNTKSRI